MGLPWLKVEREWEVRRAHAATLKEHAIETQSSDGQKPCQLSTASLANTCYPTVLPVLGWADANNRLAF